MLRAAILTWLFASVPLSLVIGRMFRAMHVEPCLVAQGELRRRAAASDR